MFIIKHVRLFLGIAVAVFVLSCATLAVYGFTFGIDFTGGSLTEVSYETRPEKSAVEARLNTLELGGYSLRESTDEAERDGFILRTRDLSESERQAVQNALALGGEASVADGRFTSIGPVIGEELKSKAIVAVSIVALIIVLYVAFAFRGIQKPVRSWVYGAITVLALFHDVLVPTAFFAILGQFTGAEIDVLFIMALLAVLGYSVNDTIVVFDRVRENLQRDEAANKHAPFADVVGRSLSETFARSINTSLTTLLALGALYIFGGDVTKPFALVLIVGVVAGTYSSLFLASPLLVAIETWQRNKKTGV